MLRTCEVMQPEIKVLPNEDLILPRADIEAPRYYCCHKWKQIFISSIRLITTLVIPTQYSKIDLITHRNYWYSDVNRNCANEA